MTKYIQFILMSLASWFIDSGMVKTEQHIYKCEYGELSIPIESGKAIRITIDYIDEAELNG